MDSISKLRDLYWFLPSFCFNNDKLFLGKLDSLEDCSKDARKVNKLCPNGKFQTGVEKALKLLSQMDNKQKIAIGYPERPAATNKDGFNFKLKWGSECDFNSDWVEKQVSAFRDYLNKKLVPIRQAVEVLKNAHAIVSGQAA